MLTGKDIVVRIGAKEILHGVNISVQPGKIAAVLGPNGAGKSTLFRSLSGEIPHEGEITFDGRSLTSWSAEELASRRAILSQFSPMRMPFRAMEIVHMGRSPHARHSGFVKDQDIVMQAMRRTDCAHLCERSMDTLSGGEQQRVHWARVLAQIWEKPDDGGRYLFLDEPISSLDIAHQHTSLALARSLADEGIAVLIILHDLNIAAQYADSLLILKDGRLIASGLPQEVMTVPNLRAAFDITSVIESHPTDRTPCVFVPRERG
jgi:iron complex transport system ATP-binding protein